MIFTAFLVSIVLNQTQPEYKSTLATHQVKPLTFTKTLGGLMKMLEN
jgi:hypothetical protein